LAPPLPIPEQHQERQTVQSQGGNEVSYHAT